MFITKTIHRFRPVTDRWHILTVIILSALFIDAFNPSTIQAQPDTSRWIPELSMQYKRITATQISPDGDYVAYVVREPVISKTQSTFRRHLHVAAADGSVDNQYTRGKHSNFHPRWSPDGKKIAFLSTRGGKPQVYLIRLNGGEAYPITDAPTGISGFQWSPDGKRIAYLMKDPKSKAEKKREKQKRDVNRVNQEFRYNHLYTTRVKQADDTTRKVPRLTRGEFHVTGFDWSPDGKTIAFVHQPTPRANSQWNKDISTVPSDSGKVKALVEQPGLDDAPHFSPDGKKIAFTSSGEKQVPYYLQDIYLLPTSGGQAQKLANTPDRRATIISWTDRGQSLLVVEPSKTNMHLYRVPTDGDRVNKVSTGQGVYGYPVFFAMPSYSRQGDRLAFTYENTSAPPEVYVSSRKNFTRQKITAINEDLPKPETGKTKLISWSGPGGKQIEGLLTYPAGYDESDRVPLILDIHGGPHGVHSRFFTGDPFIRYIPQVFAQRGYAVLRPNPRGSTGYGKSFRSAVVEDWGGNDYRDLMKGVDRVIDMGVAHPDSLAIMGGSYGGYMTARAVTKTDRFEAASMAAGLSNLISFVGTTDIPSGFKRQMGGEFWNIYDEYEQHSPIYQVEEVTTPTLVFHGKLDQRVPASQGREFYRALKRRGIATEMVLYPRTPHVPREPKLLIDLNQRIIDWFDEHLGRD
ncbi:MAG: S9 family peptidase [Bacteroidales bacterium]|nr:S9 family peptidase [Bacteroidales bacterium]